ncbi:efflux RND transporter periplasmic adaptor subunit [Rubritalea tangerina]|uniref:Efflux RND transporter periplasmic adaptor subunit n=1 Tax=Rubritalea tangerina TaxID=430798 RepID=A0ABW4ZCY6_9BACT
MTKMQRFLRIIPAILILAVGAWGWNHFASQKEDAEKNAGPKLTKEQRKAKAAARALANAQQTHVLELSAQDFQVELTSHGIVQPPAITALNPQVSGIIQKISPHFENGAFVKKDEVLVELDPSDFNSQISSAKAALARAEANLAQEQARAAQALRNWQDIGFDEEPNDLVLRKPQLKEAEANVAAQEAALEKAQRNLERTKIRSPYDGRIRSRNIGLGQSVGTGTKLGEVYATSYAEVRLPLSTRQLGKIDIDEIDFDHIPVVLTDALHAHHDTQWEARIVRIEGELDPTSRELFVVARVNDPFGIDTEHRPHPLRMNQPVAASIQANTLKQVVSIPRSAIYGKDEIIVVRDNKIHREQINIVWSTLDRVFTDTPDLDKALLATSKLAYAPEGSPVRIIEKETHSITSVAPEK